MVDKQKLIADVRLPETSAMAAILLPLTMWEMEDAMKHHLIQSLIFGLLCSSWAVAEVADSGNNGFTIKNSLTIQAAPEDVYRHLIGVGDWWNPEHTFSGDAHNLSLEQKPGGCFCEKLPNQGGVRHMQVVYVDPGKILRMIGGLGPLQSMAATGSMTIGLSPAGNGTKLELTYAVTGYVPAGMNNLAAPVDSVLTQQFTRLKNYVERGDPAPKGETKPK
jgi:hypothetical protein